MQNGNPLHPLIIDYPIITAKTFLSRFLGLMGKSRVDYGLYLFPCKSIHTFFMKVPIDVIYLDKTLTVIAIDKDMKPWKTGRYYGKAHGVLELPAGMTDELQITTGQQLQWGIDVHT